MVVSLSANAFNVLLNWLLIYGYWGMPELGIEGAGWASLISRILMAVGMAIYCYKASIFQINLPHGQWFKYKLIMLRRLISLGIPMGLQFVFEVGAFTGAVLMAGWISDTAQAAHQIAINLAAITYMIASGISAAATVQVGNFAGRQDKVGMRRAWLAATLLVLIMQIGFAIIFLVGRNWLPTLYIDNQNVIQLASGLLMIAAFFQLSDGIQVVGLGALRGVEDVKIPTWITLFAYWLLALPVGYFFGFKLNLGLIGIWWGLLIGLSTAAVLLASRFWYLSKQVNSVNPQS
jgi:MATE family multidrug resistance protein